MSDYQKDEAFDDDRIQKRIEKFTRLLIYLGKHEFYDLDREMLVEWDEDKFDFKNMSDDEVTEYLIFMKLKS